MFALNKFYIPILLTILTIEFLCRENPFTVKSPKSLNTVQTSIVHEVLLKMEKKPKAHLYIK